MTRNPVVIMTLLLIGCVEPPVGAIPVCDPAWDVVGEVVRCVEALNGAVGALPACRDFAKDACPKVPGYYIGKHYRAPCSTATTARQREVCREVAP